MNKTSNWFMQGNFCSMKLVSLIQWTLCPDHWMTHRQRYTTLWHQFKKFQEKLLRYHPEISAKRFCQCKPYDQWCKDFLSSRATASHVHLGIIFAHHNLQPEKNCENDYIKEKPEMDLLYNCKLFVCQLRLQIPCHQSWFRCSQYRFLGRWLSKVLEWSYWSGSCVPTTKFVTWTFIFTDHDSWINLVKLHDCPIQCHVVLVKVDNGCVAYFSLYGFFPMSELRKFQSKN